MSANDELVVRSVWRHLGGDPGTIDGVLARHREPHRRYHTAKHVAAVLRCVEELLREGEIADGADAGGDADAVRLAAIYHDVVYDPARGDNEAVSAQLAAEAAAAAPLRWSAERCATVQRLVEATASHVPADALEAVLIDADLAILGADPAAYAAYVTGVREEYAHVTDPQWRSGRAEVLHRFLARETIFSTEAMRDRAERRARANIAAELAALTGQ